MEWDMTWAANENNTFSFSGSYNDAELQNDFWRTSQDQEDGLPPNAPKGTPMPYVPKWQWSGIWRNNFTMFDLPAFFQTAISYTGARWNDLDTLNVPARTKMPPYTLVNLSVGVEKDDWSLSFFINNLLDERAVINVADPGYGGLVNLERPPGHAWTTTTNRPRFYALRWTQRF